MANAFADFATPEAPVKKQNAFADFAAPEIAANAPSQESDYAPGLDLNPISENNLKGLGKGARSVLQGAGSLPSLLVNTLNSATQFMPGVETIAPPVNYGGSVADALGLPKPENDTDRMIGAATEAVSGAAVPLGALGMAGKAFAPGVVSNELKMSAVGGLGAEAAHEQFPDSPLAELVGGVAAPLGYGATRGAAKIVGERLLSPQTKTFINELPKLGFTGAKDAAISVNDAHVASADSIKTAVRDAIMNRKGDVPGSGATFEDATQVANDSVRSPLAAFLAGLVNPSGGRGREAAGNAFAAKAVANDVAASALDRKAAVASIDATKPLRTGGYAPTSSTASNDEGLLASGGRLSSEPRVMQQIRQNENSIAAGLDKVTTPVGADAVETQKFFGKEVADRRAAAEAPVAPAKLASELADIDLENQRRNLMAGGSSDVRSAAGETAREEILANKSSVKKNVVDPAYAKIDPEIPITFDNTVQAAKSILLSKGANESLHPLVEQIISTRGPFGKLDKFSELQSDLAVVNKALRVNPEEAYSLGKLKDGILADLDAAGANHPELADANRIYREQYAVPFKHDVSGKVLKKGQNGSDSVVPPSETLDRYLRHPEGAQQLKRALGGSVEGAKAVRDWFVSDMASRMGSSASHEKIDSYLLKNADVLKEFPTVRSEIQQTRNLLKASGDRSSALKTDMESKMATFKEQSGSIDKSLAASIADKGVNAGNLLKPADMALAMKEARADTTGKALEGLKNAVREHLNTKLRTSGGTSSAGDITGLLSLKTSHDQLTKILYKDKDARASLEMLLGKPDVDALEQLHRQRSVEMRRSVKPVDDSGTAFRQSQASSLIKKMPWSAPFAPLTKAAEYIVSSIRELGMKDPIGKYNQLYIDSELNPELAKAFLLKPSDVNLEKARRVFIPYLQQAGNYSQGEKEESK